MVELKTQPVVAAPLTATNLHLVERLWPDRVAYTGREFAAAIEAARRLLEAERAQGAVVLEGGRPRAYGLTAFVDAAFADAYLAAPFPQIGKRLLVQAPRHAILDSRGIAAGNAGSGLHLVILSTNYDVAAADVHAVLGRIMQAFFETHRGFRIERAINEVIGEAMIKSIVHPGAYKIVCRFDEIAPGTGLPSAVGVMTRARAGMPLLPLFLYHPPRVRFTPSEQQVLRAALDGAPDDVVSTRLGLPLSAVKARWTRIHQRVASRAPDVLASKHASINAGSRRGPQTRHLVLAYVREHPSELTPYPRQD